MFIREMRVYELIEVDQNGVRRLASGYFRVLKYFTHNHGLYPMGLYKVGNIWYLSPLVLSK